MILSMVKLIFMFKNFRSENMQILQNRFFGAVRLILPFLLLLSGCSKKDMKTQKILARVGNRTITVEDFLNRSELTIRPKYPSKSGYELNKILLDNLIAEKILAVQAGDTCQLAKSDMFKAYIQGIREQTMREEMFFKVAYNKVKIDTNEIKSLFRFAGREYKVGFYTITKDEAAQEIQNKILLEPDKAGKVFDEIGDGRKVPEQTVAWKDPKDDMIQDALFTHPVKLDTVIGPLRLGKNLYVLMKVLDWKDQPVFGGDEVQARWNEVVDKTRMRKAKAIWTRLEAKLMKGKRIHFNPPVFKKLAELSFGLYSAPSDSQRQDMLAAFFGKNNDLSQIETLGNKDVFLKSPFFTLDGKTWTVEDFKKELAVHPLVYRTKNFTQKTFPNEFKNAIADMIRDRYLAQEAYKKHIQNDDVVKSRALTWRDAVLGSWERDQTLARLAKKHHLEGKTDKLTKVYIAYMDSLMRAYSGRIFINDEELKKINLTNIDFYAFKPGVPYPRAVPSFQEFIFNVR
jgi:hypothetical protein